MREIEIKVRIDNAKTATAALAAAGIALDSAKTQHDIVYARPGAIDNDPNENWLRIRSETSEGDTTHTFTLKRSVTGELDSIEHETVIDNPDELQKIITYLGYDVCSDLTKTRQKGRIDTIEVCIDEVPGLGIFVELEKLCDERVNPEAVVVELEQALANIGIASSEKITQGYDVMMKEKLDNSASK